MRLYLLYVLRQLAVPTLVVILTLSGAVWLSQSLRFVDLIVNRGLPTTTFLHLSVLLVPSLLLVILPYAVFFGVLYGYRRLALESELTVMRTAGLGNLQIALPGLILAAVVTLAERGALLRGESGPRLLLEDGSRQELDRRDPERPRLSMLRFERYALDLAARGAPGPRRPKTKELYLDQLLDPPPELAARQQAERIAEGHKRLSWPLSPLVFTLVALAAVLPRRHERSGAWPPIACAVVVVLGLQALIMAAGGLAARALELVPPLYLATVGPALWALAMLTGWPAPRTLARLGRARP